MYNGEHEDKQKCLDYLCKAIMETRANGSEKNNHIQELKLLTRENYPKLDGRYDAVVRPIWSEHIDRDDGYYDINVSGDSAWAMMLDVIENLRHTL